jgi:hypothetical protein
MGGATSFPAPYHHARLVGISAFVFHLSCEGSEDDAQGTTIWLRFICSGVRLVVSLLAVCVCSGPAASRFVVVVIWVLFCFGGVGVVMLWWLRWGVVGGDGEVLLQCSVLEVE